MYLRNAFQLLTTLASFLFLVSCSPEPVDIKIGEEFTVDENKLTIETIEKRKILVNDEEKMVEVAPEGKHYIYLKLHNPAEEMIFIRAMKGEEKLKGENSVTMITNFKVDIGSGYEDEIYLVDDGADIKFSLRTPGDAIYNVTNTEIPNKDDREISPKMKELMAKYQTGVNLLEPLKGFITVDNVYDIAKEKGADVATSPLVKGMEITYMSKDGSFYETRSNFLGSSLYSEIKWEGDHVVDFSFELP